MAGRNTTYKSPNQLNMEMKNIRPTFKKWEKSESNLPVRYQKIKHHFMFDIKMGKNFQRKVQLIAIRNQTETPLTLTYFSVAL
jgi:hypothetical protein